MRDTIIGGMLGVGVLGAAGFGLLGAVIGMALGGVAGWLVDCPCRAGRQPRAGGCQFDFRLRRALPIE